MEPHGSVSVGAVGMEGILSNTYQQGFIGPPIAHVTTSNESAAWAQFTSDLPYRPPCRPFRRDSGSAGKAVRATPPLPPPDVFDNPFFHNVLGSTHSTSVWNRSHLLSLPKDIRLQIWQYVLCDFSSATVVAIKRQQSLRYRLERPPELQLSFNCQNPRTCHPGGLRLLTTSKDVYEDVLPLLYQSTIFHPTDLEGLLPCFLNELSPFARKSIQTIRLEIPTISAPNRVRNDRSKPAFHWAITCAQVAGLNETLKELQIVADGSAFIHKANRRAIINPLCKIRARKTLVIAGTSASEAENLNYMFQLILDQAEAELKANAKIRKEYTKADAAARMQRNENRAKEELLRAQHLHEQRHWREMRDREYTGLSHLVIGGSRGSSEFRNETNAAHPTGIERRNDTMEEWARWAEENLQRMEHDLSLVPGIKQFEEELVHHTVDADTIRVDEEFDMSSVMEDWDMVSTNSGASTPKARPASILSESSDDWADTASTLCDCNNGAKKAEAKEDLEDWESM